MITEIGITAGEILNILDKNKETFFEVLLEKIDKPKETVLMSLGWLAREGYIVIKKGERLLIKLRKKEV